MPKTIELISELASLHSDLRELDRAWDEVPEDLHVRGLLLFAMTRLEDWISVLERKVALAAVDQSGRLEAAA
jgi:hypothetical protein